MEKKTFLKAAMVLIAAFSVFSCKENHFITDPAYRATVEKTLNARLDANGGGLRQFFDDAQAVTTAEEEALEFLYAYMPTADLTDYPTSYYLQNIRSSFETREMTTWGKNIPELYFRHFVLPIRINNENLDTARVVFFKELYPRVKDLDMKSAILEVNHWCHEKMTYQPSDARTSSPLSSLKNSFGRCGEESTFTVAALRSVGIPARQVYTPRWAHSDDNHAWVEAWADGEWYFLGACEPEAILNLGWFNAPASRGLLMHTKAFGHYNGPEEVMLEGPNFTEINLIDNYASTASSDFKVVKEDGTPVDSARVDFCIYNYAEFYKAVSKYTDKEGKTFLTAGLGDMLVWASKDGLYGYSKVSFGKDKEVTITISDDHSFTPEAIDIVPPPENVKIPEVTDEQRAENSRKLAYEDSVRLAYSSTFPPKPEDPSDRIGMILFKSKGNHQTISDFLSGKEGADLERALQLLESISAKDVRDITPENLEDSYNDKEAILCPRVEDEFLTPYKQFFNAQLTAEEKQSLKDPENLVKWTKNNLNIVNDPKAWAIPMSPAGVWTSRIADNRSRAIFFVSLAKTLGIDARKDSVTGKVQYRLSANEPWIDVDFDAADQTVAAQGTLKLIYKQVGTIENPMYYSHFSISKIVDGRTSLLAFDEGDVDMGGGVSWKSTFKDGAKLDTGTYIITSGNRLSDGSVPVTAQLFTIEEGKETDLDLIIRVPEDKVSVLGSFDSESKFVLDETGATVSVLSQTGRGYFIVGVLGVGQEPTNHTLRDIAKAKDFFEKWGKKIVLLTTDKEQMEKLKSEIATDRYGKLPSTVVLGIDQDGSIRSQIKNGLKLKNDNLPMFIVGDTFNKVYFVSQGYTIGLGEQMQGTISKL